MIRLENVSMSYGEHAVLRDVSLHIPEGKLAVLIGPSGCGKTTTLQLMNRLIMPTSGRIFVGDTDIAAVDPVELRRGIGYVIQEIGLFPHMTIRQNIEVVPKLLGWNEERRNARTTELLRLVGMEERYLERYPGKLSGGQQQRIGLLRALAADPPIILMDEPFGALDPITRESLQDEIMRLQKQLRKTIVFVTHDMDEALKIADLIIIMKDGEIVQAATPRELLRHPANAFVESFIGKHRGSRRLETIRDVMSERVVCVGSDITIVEAVDLMRREHVPSLFITDENGRFMGQVQIGDLGDAVPEQDCAVTQLMRENVPVTQDTDSARDVFRMMLDEHINEMPVLDAERRVLGIVTHRSMVLSLAGAVWEEES